MKRHYWDGKPQGQKFESFKGMQGTPERGPWKLVGALAIAQMFESNAEQPTVPEFDYEAVQIPPFEQVQGDTGPATSYL